MQGLSLGAELGSVINRRWDYHKLHYSYYRKSTEYANVSLKFRF